MKNYIFHRILAILSYCFYYQSLPSGQFSERSHDLFLPEQTDGRADRQGRIYRTNLHILYLKILESKWVKL